MLFALSAPLLQAAAQAVAVAPSSGLSTGEWVGIVTVGLAAAAALIQFGRVIANASHLRETVEDKLETMDEKLDRIAAQGEAAQQHRVADAGALANHEARIASLEKDRDRSDERRIGPPDRRD